MGMERFILAVCCSYLGQLMFSYQPFGAHPKQTGVGEAVLHPGQVSRQSREMCGTRRIDESGWSKPDAVGAMSASPFQAFSWQRPRSAPALIRAVVSKAGGDGWHLLSFGFCF